MDYEESSRYHGCLRSLVRASVTDDDLSRRSIEDALQEAILKVLCVDDDSSSFDVRIKKVADELRQKLTARRITYCCYIPVRGMKKAGLPFSVGQVEFAVFDDSLADRFREAVSKHEFQREMKLEKLEQDIKDGIHDKVCGIVNVEAKDYEAAQIVALNRLRLVLDILNFFSNMVPNHPRAWVYLPGDLEPYPFQALILNKDDGASFSLPSQRIGPLMELSILRIIESDTKYRIGFAYINSLLRKNNPNKFDQVLITAIHWAGRAVVAKRREESFLLYAIALESIILSDNPDTELSYRLRIRIALLLASGLERRLEIHNTVRDLYTLRSKLVHDGRYEITDLELESMRAIARSCLTLLCIDPKFHTMRSPKDFGDWFEKQVFS